MGYLINKIRTIGWTLFYYCFNRLIFNRIGKGCRFEGWIDIPQRSGNISLGDGVYICRHTVFTVIKNAHLQFGNNVFVGHGVTISSHQNIEIGNDCLIAEYVSIYDNDHETQSITMPISKQGYITKPCIIGEGCWIGAGAKILRGAGLGKHSILGAGSVLRKALPEQVLAGGVPARMIRHRDKASAA